MTWCINPPPFKNANKQLLCALVKRTISRQTRRSILVKKKIEGIVETFTRFFVA